MHQLTFAAPPTLGTALAQAVARLCAAQPGADVLLAELAIGRRARAREHLHTNAPDLLVAARYAAWTGDLATIAAVWQTLRPAALDLLTSEHAATADICAELQKTATDIGDVQLAAQLHRCAARPRRGGRILRATNAAAETVLRLVHATLGAEPDAPRMRLRLRPRLPADQQRLHAQNLMFADGSVQLQLEDTGDALQCRIEQTAGALPFTLLLEPYVRAPVAAAFVDTQPATLEVRSDDAGTFVPVQLVLDHERSLRIEYRPLHART